MSRTVACRTLAVCAVIALGASSPEVKAGGLFLPGIGPQAQARAGAFVAKADDLSAIANNPAGLARVQKLSIALGANVIDFDLQYQRAGSYETTSAQHAYEGTPYPLTVDASTPEIGIGGAQIIPTLLAASPIPGPWNLRIGGGIFAPQAFGNRNVAETYDQGTPGDAAPAPHRYDVISQEVALVQPSLAMSASPYAWLDAGLRVSWGIMQINNRSSVWGVNNFDEAPEKDGTVDLRAADYFVPNFALGFLARPAPAWELGATYRSPMRVAATGEAVAQLGSAVGVGGSGDIIEPNTPASGSSCGGNGRIGAIATCVDLTLPQAVTVGARWKWGSAASRIEDGLGFDIELDLQWEDWSSASRYHITVEGKSGLTGLPLNRVDIAHGLHDTYGARLGGTLSLPVASGTLEIRAGAAFDTEAADESWNRIDFDSTRRTTLGLGLAFELRGMRVEMGLGRTLTASRSVATCQPPDGPTTSQPGCSADGVETAVYDRTSPDPAQPLDTVENSAQSPFNAGDYTSRYLLFSLGLAASF